MSMNHPLPERSSEERAVDALGDFFNSELHHHQGASRH